MGAGQDLKQKVCQKYGWSYEYGQNDKGDWFVDVIVFLKKYRFTSQGELGEKRGKEAASALALEGLTELIASEESKPVCQLKEVFPNPIPTYDSTDLSIWSKFWKNPPKVVGIDTEGNQKTPPVLVQISIPEYTILEAPKKTISSNLQRLLDDDNIIKVFCDNFSHNDKTSLGIDISSSSSSSSLSAEIDFSKPPIVDLEYMCANIYGKVKVARGLSKILTMCMPELNVRISKPSGRKNRMKNVGRFVMIEQGKSKPLKGVHELSEKEKQYAALDSWCTLEAYTRIIKIQETKIQETEIQQANEMLSHS